MKKFLSIVLMNLIFVAFVDLEILDGEQLTDLQNYIFHFNPSHLSEFLTQRKYVVMLFEDNQCTSKACRKRMIKFRKISFKFVDDEVLFIQMSVNSPAEAQKYLGLSVPSLPHLSMSSFGFKKNFEGEMRELKIWIREMLDHIPSKVESLDDIKDIDKHFYVLLDKTAITIEDFDLAMLSKLIHPIGLYFGIPHDSEDVRYKKIVGQKGSSNLIAYREYDDFVLPLDSNEDMHELAQIIRNHEYPEHCNLTLKTMKFITHHQLPTFLYFNYSPEEKAFYKIFKKLSKEYKNYLMFCTVDLKAVNESLDNELKFYINLMGGGIPRKSNRGMIRIAHFTDRFRRFRSFGPLKEPTAQFLIRNYLHDNIKEYVASEPLGEKNFIKLATGIRKINKKKFDELLTHKLTTHLVYVYSSTTQSLSSDIGVLVTLARALEKNKHFSISVLDHDRNDLDGQIHTNLPYVLLCNSTFKRKAFKGTFNFTSILTFLAENVSWLKLKESFLEELKNDYGIDLISQIKEANQSQTDDLMKDEIVNTNEDSENIESKEVGEKVVASEKEEVK